MHEGPFDAVLGFSQGALLAATLIVKHARESSVPTNPTFKFAIFIYVPGAVDDRTKGRMVSFRSYGILIQLPTAHIIGSKDPGLEGSVKLSKVCDEKTKKVFEHSQGHEAPRGSKITLDMAQCITRVINKVDFAHLAT